MTAEADAMSEDKHTVGALRQLGVWLLRSAAAVALMSAVWWTGYVWDSIGRIPSQDKQRRVTQHLDVEVPAMQQTLVRLATVAESITALSLEREKNREKEYAEIMRRLDRIERQTRGN